jgi:hypothetical protein
MQITDWNYLYALVSFLIGVFSGFQAIYVRYPKASVAAALTLPGSFYLFSRGALPACIFAAFYHYGLLKSYLFLYALGLGVGAETVLRSQVLIKQTNKQGGGIDELLKGPLDLLRWYQDLFLVEISTRNARQSQDFVKKQLPPGDFKVLCTRVRDNAGAFNEPMVELEEAINKLSAEFDGDTSAAGEKNERYRLKLGYTVLRLAGKENFRTLFKA